MRLSDDIKTTDPPAGLIDAIDMARPGERAWIDNAFTAVAIASRKRDAWAWALVYFLEWVRRGQ